MTRVTHEPRNPRNAGKRTQWFPRSRGFRGWVVLASVVVLAMPVAANHEVDPDAPYDFRNSDVSPFGSVGMPVYLDAPAGEPLALEVPVTLHPEALADPAARYLVGFNLHNADIVQLADVAVTFKGKPVDVERDERSSAAQPRLIIPGDALPRTGTVDLLLTGTATASADGRIHVGALAIAFDAAWGTLRTTDGEAAQAYAFTLLMSEGHASSGLAPRFHGDGNSAVVFVPLVAMLGLTSLGLRAAWRRLHAPEPQAATPVVGVPVQPATAHSAGPASTMVPATFTAMAPPRPATTVASAPRPVPTPFQPVAPTRIARVQTRSGVAAFPRLLEDPLAHPAPATLPVAVVRRKQPRSAMPVVAGSPLPVGRVVAVETPLASASSSIVARPTRPSRASQAKARASSFEVFESR